MTRLHRAGVGAFCLLALLNMGLRQGPDSAADRKTARIAVLGALPPLTDAKDAEATVTVLKKAGYAPVTLSPQQLADNSAFNERDFDLLILPHSAAFPEPALKNLDLFLKRRGRLLCIAGPAFSRLAVPEGEQWKALSEDAAKAKIPTLESLSPPYKGVFVGSEIAGAWLPIKRHRGLGLERVRPGRLMSADPRGEEEGYGVESRDKQWVYLSMEGSYRGALWGGTVKPEHPGEPTFSPLAPIVERLLQNVFLAQAGTDGASYRVNNDAITVGATLINLGKEQAAIVGEVEIRAEQGTPPVIDGVKTFDAKVAGNMGKEEVRFPIPALPSGEYSARVTLFRPDGKEGDEREVLDRITMPFRVLPKAWGAKPEEFVRVKGKEFMLNSKPWRPFGIHFVPRWVAGQETEETFHNWLSPMSYDPQLVERDLELCERLGFNMLTVTYSWGDQKPAFWDFLVRCRNHRLKVNVVLANKDPDAVSEPNVATFLESAQLRDNPTLCAVTFQMQSLISPDTKADVVRARLNRLIERLKPEGIPVSVRFTDTRGRAINPPFQLKEITDLVDFLTVPCPPLPSDRDSLREANESKVTLPAIPVTTQGGKPVLLDGFGYNLHAVTGKSEERLRKQADAYKAFLTQAKASSAKGMVFWWLPGGIRLEDGSDFGIVGADGIPRPVAQYLKQFAAP